MKKIKRLSLNGLKETCLLLDDTTKMSILGGGGKVNISNGTLENMQNGVQYVGTDGTTCFFEGVNFVIGGTLENTAYQFNGTIHIDESWLKNGFNVDNFAHEYGHHLQQQEMGTLYYFAYVAIPSVWNEWAEGGSGHSSMPYEKDADKRGSDYYNKNKHVLKSDPNGK